MWRIQEYWAIYSEVPKELAEVVAQIRHGEMLFIADAGSGLVEIWNHKKRAGRSRKKKEMKNYRKLQEQVEHFSVRRLPI